MKRILLVSLLLIGFSFAFRVTQGIDEAQAAVVKAYRAGAKEKAPYLYSKTKAYKEISALLASEADDVGSKMFAIRAMNYASKAISSAFSGKEELTPLDEPPAPKEGDLVDLKEIKERLDFLRSNKGELCSPQELGRAEAFYDALVYELGKETPSSTLLLKFMGEARTESKTAESKLKVAMENKFECYTGVRKEAKPPEEKPKGEETVKEEPKGEEKEAKKEEEKPKEVAEEKPKEEKTAQEEPKGEKMEAKKVEENLKITARIHFDFDKYTIKKEYLPILNEVARTLKENQFVKVRIEGFTDAIGSKEYNDKLALKRAESVKSYLVKQGVPEEKIEIVGFGKERFITGNEDPVGRLTNRRVEFIILKVQGE